MSKQRVIFRADGNSAIGIGHISRCLALAEILRDNFEVIFAICEPESHILIAINSICDHIISLPKTTQALDFTSELIPHLKKNDVVVIDGYQFATDYEKKIKAAGVVVATINDIPDRHFVADAVINFCGAISKNAFSKECYTQLCLGLDYLFLRSPFLRVKVPRKSMRERILVNMGGADPGNETLNILKFLLGIRFAWRIEVIVGQNYMFSDQLDSLVSTHNHIWVRRGLSAQEMFDVMTNCPVAILPPSTVALEFLSTGGLLFLKKTAENQNCINTYLQQERWAYDFAGFQKIISEYGIKEPVLLSSLSDIIDGTSISRVERLFNSLSFLGDIKFRKATILDSKLCFDWATDPEARRYSYSRSEIKWDEHIQWFDRKIADPTCVYLIAELGDTPIGQVRFDLSNKEMNTFVISYLIDRTWRGKGLGRFILLKAIEQLMLNRSVSKIIGFVQNSNIASIKAFSESGFEKKDSTEYPDSCRFELLPVVVNS